MSKNRKKDYPCLKCDIHVKKNEAAIQCNICELWAHQKCADLSDVLFRELVHQAENNGGTFWSCKSCRSASTKFNRQITEIYKKVEDLEQGHHEIRSEVEAVKGSVKEVDSKVDKMIESNSKASEKFQDEVFAELRDREERKKNIIIHNLDEPGQDVTRGIDRKKEDHSSVITLLTFLDCLDKPEEEVKFVRRIGERSTTTRPMLIGFRSSASRDKVLRNAHKLSGSRYVDTSLIPDLTKRQRKEDEEVRKFCDEKNRQRQGDDLNFIWKPVGPRGERRAVKSRQPMNTAPPNQNQRPRRSFRTPSTARTDLEMRRRLGSDKRGREQEMEEETSLQNPAKSSRT